MLPNSFITANLERLEAEDDRQGLIDAITDAIGYQGERRRRFLQRLESLPYRRLVGVVYRYWRRGKANLPEGWHAVDGDTLEAEADRARLGDARNVAERFKVSLRRRNGRITARRRRVTTARLDKYAVEARECRERRGGECAGCNRLNKVGYCWKWGLYTERPQTLVTAAAF